MTAAEKIARRAIVAEPSHIKPTRVLLKAESAGVGEHLKVAPLPPALSDPCLPRRRCTFAIPFL